MAIGEGEVGGRQAANVAGPRDDVGPIEAGGDFAAVGATIHHHRAADRAGDTGQELESAQAGGGGMLRHRYIQRGGSGDDTVGFRGNGVEAAGKANGDARQAAVTKDEVGTGANHVHRRGVRQGAEEGGEVVRVGGTVQRLGRPADAKPGERGERGGVLRAAAERCGDVMGRPVCRWPGQARP